MMLFGGYLARLPALWRCFGSRKERLLATFDFDKTIIDVDSYQVLSQLLSPEQRTEQLFALIHNSDWLTFIQRVLRLLQLEQCLSAAQIGQHTRRLPPVPGMLHLLRRMERYPALDMCIVSDANSYMIGEWLAAHGLEHIFKAGIHTNPVTVQPDGQLLVEPYELQTHCDQCPPNMCKGGIMHSLMTSCNVAYSRIIYVGDGCNDLCAIRRLRPDDVACIRRGEELYDKLPGHRHELSCQLLDWRDGHELEDKLFATVLHL
ncbi:pyridoxal phosphate phosphatase PHOSPHO2 [Drosophila virilis]|uniref:Uncharacterized protein n=1 Tax=Drosophila virilis TaxID=7244 RepID=B4MAY3_DROVI|nr:pyridoxal phosphate phosphatase PHOSPHO2 [Drosophila virilis]EDW66392.2 uncharacterized protein Dvir_GJ16003 [Drosophila virilis]